MTPPEAMRAFAIGFGCSLTAYLVARHVFQRWPTMIGPTRFLLSGLTTIGLLTVGIVWWSVRG